MVSSSDAEPPFIIPAGHCWVLADNTHLRVEDGEVGRAGVGVGGVWGSWGLWGVCVWGGRVFEGRESVCVWENKWARGRTDACVCLCGRVGHWGVSGVALGFTAAQ